jgi:hypothetical protein
MMVMSDRDYGVISFVVGRFQYTKNPPAIFVLLNSAQPSFFPSPTFLLLRPSCSLPLTLPSATQSTSQDLGCFQGHGQHHCSLPRASLHTTIMTSSGIGLVSNSGPIFLVAMEVVGAKWNSQNHGKAHQARSRTSILCRWIILLKVTTVKRKPCLFSSLYPRQPLRLVAILLLIGSHILQTPSYGLVLLDRMGR